MERVRMSTGEKAELWRRWKRGESLSDIGRALGRIRPAALLRRRGPHRDTVGGPRH